MLMNCPVGEVPEESACIFGLALENLGFLYAAPLAGGDLLCALGSELVHQLLDGFGDFELLPLKFLDRVVVDLHSGVAGTAGDAEVGIF